MGGIYDAQWSPDGNWIAIKGRIPGEEEGHRIYLLDVYTGAVHSIIELKYGSISWSPDSEWIAFSTYSPDGRGRIFKIKRDGAELQQLTELDCSISGLSWSPQ